MPSYSITNLTKRFSSTLALDGVTFTAAAGELLVILGPTGAGKTTLLRTIAGLEMPEGGAVAQASADEGVGTTDITRASPAARDIAMVFQNFSLYPRLSVYENLAFPLRPKWRRMDSAEIDRRVRWAAELLGLTPKLTNMSIELSGGQQQRVAIGRAIVREPRLFLFDEPLASLDAKLREAMTIEIHRLQRRLGTTMLYVTHDQLEAMSLADRMLVLDHGRILQSGTPDEIYHRPASPRVARILGSPPINLLTPEQFTALFPGIPLPADAATVGLRPEYLQLSPSSDAAAPRVTVIERLGPASVVFVQWQQVTLRVLAPANTPLLPGQAVVLKTTARNVLTWPGGIAVSG